MSDHLFGELLVGGRGNKLTTEQRDAYTLWSGDCWAFLTGVWPLPRHVAEKGSKAPKPIVWTNDPHENQHRPFPAEYDYLRYALVEPITLWPHGERLPPMVADKPRQEFVTTGILLTITHEVLFKKAVMWLVAKNKKEEAQDLIVEKMRFCHDHLPKWLRLYRPVNRKPAGRFRGLKTGSVAKAVGRNFGQSEAKGSTADVFIDEAPLLGKLESAVEAAQAMARRIVMVGTPPEEGQADPDSVAYYRSLITGTPKAKPGETVVGAPDEGWAPEELIA